MSSEEQLKTHARIAYIVSRLISGRKVGILFDMAGAREVGMPSEDAEFRREFDERHSDYIPGYATDCTYRYDAGDGFRLEIFINEKTFIVHIIGTPGYFIGNIQGEMIYLYDHREAAHFRYRVIEYISEKKETEAEEEGFRFRTDR